MLQKSIIYPIQKFHKCQLCHQVVDSFYLWRLHKQKMHNAQNVSKTNNVDVTHSIGEIDDESLEKDMETWKHFLVDSEMEIGRHREFNFAMEIVDADNLSKKNRQSVREA